MILTCPDCATSYFVDDAKIPAHGRTVKCASCGHHWTATGEPELTIDDLLEADAVEIAPDEAEAEPEIVAETEDAGPSAAERRAALRAQTEAEAKRRRKQLVVQLGIWGGMAAGLAALLTAAALLRVDVVRLWPQSAGAYAAVGLPVNTVGLEIADLKYQPTLQDGHASMSVTGALRNVAEHPVTSPPLRLRLLDADGEALTTQIARPADAVVPTGADRHFAIVIRDWPTAARELEVSFALDLPQPKAKAAEEAGHKSAPLPASGGHASEPHG